MSKSERIATLELEIKLLREEMWQLRKTIVELQNPLKVVSPRLMCGTIRDNADYRPTGLEEFIPVEKLLTKAVPPPGK